MCGGILEDGGLFITCSSDMCFCITHTGGKCEEIGLYQERHQIIVLNISKLERDILHVL